MDFEALRARADDIVTGIAADVTESVLEVIDEVLDLVENATNEAESYKTSITFDGAVSPEEVARKVQETLSRVKQAKPAPSKTGGSEVPTREELVRYAYRYLTQNHGAYMEWTSQYEDYNANSQWASDKVVLFEDLADLFAGRVAEKKKPEA